MEGVVVVGGAVLGVVVDFLVVLDEDEDEEDEEEAEVGMYQTLSTASVLPQPSRV